MTKRVWTYGDEGERYPVQVGEVWQVGDHLFVCSDLMACDDFDRLVPAHVSGPMRGLLYCDPPWGQSLVNSFRTKAGLGRAEYRWEDLYRRIAAIGHDRVLPVWVEGSVITSRDGRKIPATLENSSPRAGRPTYSGYVEVVYYGKHPSGLYYSGPTPVDSELIAELRGRDDDDTPGIVMRHHPATTGVVLDPCAGRGVTSRQAQEQGWLSINNELSPHRVSAALSRMVDMLGGEVEPRRLG